jgi:hypothetical protein
MLRDQRVKAYKSTCGVDPLDRDRPKRIECIGLENSTILEKKQNKQTTKEEK